GITFKVLGIAALALLMLIPLAQVNGLVREREARAVGAAAQIAERWGGRQMVGGPVLVVPVRWQEMHDKGPVTHERREFVLPDRLSIRATLATELRRYGMYATPVYTAELHAEGRFDAADLAALALDGRQPQWSRAELRVPVADVRGIRRVSELRVDAGEATFGPDQGGVGRIAAITAPIDLAGAAQPLAFAFDMTL